MKNEDIYQDFGKRLKTIRKEHKLTQKELANLLNISSSAINHYENGNRKINIDMLNKMANCFSITVDELIGTKKEVEKDEIEIPPNIDKATRKWYEAVGELNFNEREFQELVNYAKYIVSKRKKGGGY